MPIIKTLAASIMAAVLAIVFAAFGISGLVAANIEDAAVRAIVALLCGYGAFRLVRYARKGAPDAINPSNAGYDGYNGDPPS